MFVAFLREHFDMEFGMLCYSTLLRVDMRQLVNRGSGVSD